MATIKKRGNSYLIRVSCGYDINGKHKEQSITWKPDDGMTKKQIEKELNRQAVLFEQACSEGYRTSSVKFQNLAEEWFEQYAETKLKKSTVSRMRSSSKRIYPTIGNVKVEDLSSRQIQKYINSLTKPGVNKRSGGRLAYTTIRTDFMFIRSVLNYAVLWDYTSVNVCDKVILPKNDSKEKQIYTKEEMQQLLTSLESAELKYKVFFYMAAYTGLRRGELLGLEWSDINFENGTIHIVRTSNYTAKDGLYEDTTKTASSNRVLKLSPDIIVLLSELREQQRSVTKKRSVHSNRLFLTRNQTPMSVNTPYIWLRAYCRKNNLPFYGIHSFRHFTASALISNGVDVATVSSVLGHGGKAITLQTYIHQFQDAHTRAASVMDGVFESFLNNSGQNSGQPSHCFISLFLSHIQKIYNSMR